jgi:hypothetical protein
MNASPMDVKNGGNPHNRFQA